MSTFSNAPLTINPGSSLYYALLYTSISERNAICLLINLFQTLHDISYHVSEISVAKAKLQWWATEIRLLFQGKPQHSLSQALVPIIADYQLPEAEFQLLIQGFASSLDQPITSTDSLMQLCRQVGGAKAILLSHIFAGEKICAPFCEQMGIALALMEQIRDYGKDLRKGKCYIPNETPENYQEKLAEHAKLAKTHYQNALQALNQRVRYAHLPLLILSKIQFSLLTEIEREQFNVLSHQYHLTPLRKFGIAWRTMVVERFYRFLLALNNFTL